MTTANRLNHVHLLVTDLSRAIAFYEQVFGLQHAYDEEEHGDRLAFLHTAQQDVLTLHLTRNPELVSPGGLVHFGFTVAAGGLDSVERAVQDNDGRVLGRAGWNPDEVVYVKDPDGYTVEVYARD